MSLHGLRRSSCLGSFTDSSCINTSVSNATGTPTGAISVTRSFLSFLTGLGVVTTSSAGFLSFTSTVYFTSAMRSITFQVTGVMKVTITGKAIQLAATAKLAPVGSSERPKPGDTDRWIWLPPTRSSLGLHSKLAKLFVECIAFFFLEFSGDAIFLLALVVSGRLTIPTVLCGADKHNGIQARVRAQHNRINFRVPTQRWSTAFDDSLCVCLAPLTRLPTLEASN
mmetsp:Transcript_48996/g.123246  ORF Transcript_48996/g.123246 Transcript_48996/m.123246 type:complete len:225 (+) Transcript_48996:1059-1733(+)